jgi:hypothetical protein
MEITSRIIKGGALLDESRLFIERWDPSKLESQNLREFRAGNLLGKRSRARTEDAVAILRQRFVEPGGQVISALKQLSIQAEAFRDACYFEAARNDDLLAYVAGRILREMWARGRTQVAVSDVDRALLTEPPAPIVAEWSESTRTRVIHGVLSSLRDFGILEGQANKRIATPRISFGGFVYVLGRLREESRSTHEVVAAPVWSWWLLEERQIRAHILEADRHAILRFSDAGSVMRIDWRTADLEEMVGAVG